MSALKFAFAFCLVALVAQFAAAKDQVNKMALYQVANIRNFPFTVQLRNKNGDFVCAGALISTSHVLTAAECFDNNDYSNIVVVAGATTVSDAGVERHISKVTKHESADAAVVELEEAMALENRKIEVIDLATESIAAEASVYIMGWRHITPLASNSGQLFATTLPVSDQAECEKEFSESNIFCIEGRFDEQFCVGDLGSPAVYSKKLVGITSDAHNCKAAEHITSYTSVSAIHDFIVKAMN